MDLRPLTFKLKKQTEQALGINEEFGLNIAYSSLVCKLKPKPRWPRHMGGVLTSPVKVCRALCSLFIDQE